MTLAHLAVFTGCAAIITAGQHGVTTGDWLCALLTITAAIGWYVAAAFAVTFGDLAFWTIGPAVALGAGILSAQEGNAWPAILGLIALGAMWVWRSRP